MEDVKFLVGNAFSPDKVELLVTDFSKGGIFHWSESSIKVAQSIHLGATLQDKQVILVTYMLEVLDGLMIDPTFNVSESPCTGSLPTKPSNWALVLQSICHE